MHIEREYWYSIVRALTGRAELLADHRVARAVRAIFGGRDDLPDLEHEFEGSRSTSNQTSL